MRIYETHTWAWLSDLSAQAGRRITLASVPAADWDRLVEYHFDAVWLMGVWRRSEAARAIALEDANIVGACQRVLPGYTPDDLVGSPYAIADYVVDERLGGAEGLAAARAQLAARGMKLLLDFVPNHTAPDHPWTLEHPDYYVPGTNEDAAVAPGRFLRTAAGAVLARGAPSQHERDVWRDTAQLNALSPGCRRAATDTLLEMAAQCDGVRCDMAHLMLDDVFRRTWQPGATSPVEFWSDVVTSVREQYPGFVFIAESYGNTQADLLALGFDYCYDKESTYDVLAWGEASSLQRHLAGCSPEHLARLVHFLENHDEPPVENCFVPAARHRLAAVAVATLPGATLWYDRQFEGRWGKPPIQLDRSATFRDFYRRLFAVTDRAALREGQWSLCPVHGTQSLLAWCWRSARSRLLVILNLLDDEVWGTVGVPWESLRHRSWKLHDLLTGALYAPRDGDAMFEGRLVIGLPAWGVHLFEVLED